jgi:hypothetical protein
MLEYTNVTPSTECCMAVKEKAVILKLSELQKELEQLRMNIGGLQSRLSFLLLPEEMCVKAKDSPPRTKNPVCPMEEIIQDRIDKVTVLVRQTSDVLTRLQV